MRSTARQAEVAAHLRRFIAQHDEDRRARCALIRRLEDYVVALKQQNMVTAAVVRRLRQDAAHYEADAERARRRRRQATTNQFSMGVAA